MNLSYALQQTAITIKASDFNEPTQLLSAERFCKFTLMDTLIIETIVTKNLGNKPREAAQAALQRVIDVHAESIYDVLREIEGKDHYWKLLSAINDGISNEPEKLWQHAHHLVLRALIKAGQRSEEFATFIGWRNNVAAVFAETVATTKADLTSMMAAKAMAQ